jgi:hypothetical protein
MTYSEKVAGLRVSVLIALLLCLGALSSFPQQPAEAAPEDHFFSGTVTAKTEDSITVTRSVLGKSPVTRTFTISPETRIEGKLRVKARVTVRYIEREEGDVAVHVIVRSGQKKDQK